jgi:hypothetical protein
MPDMAAAGRQLIYQHGPIGLGYLATVRSDGGPRVHPICAHIAEDELWAFIGAPSPKRADLLRDARYAFHVFPCPDVDDEFYVRGVAAPCADADLVARVRAQLPYNSEEDDQPFTLRIDRALLARYGPRPSWPPQYTKWRLPVGSG